VKGADIYEEGSAELQLRVSCIPCRRMQRDSSMKFDCSRKAYAENNREKRNAKHHEKESESLHEDTPMDRSVS
jgi:hypothetical protein